MVEAGVSSHYFLLHDFYNSKYIFIFLVSEHLHLHIISFQNHYQLLEIIFVDLYVGDHHSHLFRVWTMQFPNIASF
jgi:hypothetical protein